MIPPTYSQIVQEKRERRRRRVNGRNISLLALGKPEQRGILRTVLAILQCI